MPVMGCSGRRPANPNTAPDRRGGPVVVIRMLVSAGPASECSSVPPLPVFSAASASPRYFVGPGSSEGRGAGAHRRQGLPALAPAAPRGAATLSAARTGLANSFGFERMATARATARFTRKVLKTTHIRPGTARGLPPVRERSTTCPPPRRKHRFRSTSSSGSSAAGKRCIRTTRRKF